MSNSLAQSEARGKRAFRTARGGNPKSCKVGLGVAVGVASAPWAEWAPWRRA